MFNKENGRVDFKISKDCWNWFCESLIESGYDVLCAADKNSDYVIISVGRVECAENCSEEGW